MAKEDSFTSIASMKTSGEKGPATLGPLPGWALATGTSNGASGEILREVKS